MKVYNIENSCKIKYEGVQYRKLMHNHAGVHQYTHAHKIICICVQYRNLCTIIYAGAKSFV